MKLKKLFLSLLLSIFALNVFAQGENPVSWSSKVTNVKDNVYEVQLLGSIEGKWHIYDLGPYQDGPIPTTLVITGGQGVKVVGKPYIKTKVHKYFDQMFNMEIGTCENGVVIAQKVEVTNANPTEITATLEWQTCDDGSCLPPTDDELKIKLPAAKGVVAAAAADDTKGAAVVNEPAKSDVAVASTTTDTATIADVVKEDVKIAAEEDKGDVLAAQDGVTQQAGATKSLWGVILEAIAWGFVALLTPCVFPMVPMTVSFFLKNSGGTDRKSVV